jgi:hypothetical protein
MEAQFNDYWLISRQEVYRWLGVEQEDSAVVLFCTLTFFEKC